MAAADLDERNVTLAVLGGMGDGKSTLLNALGGSAEFATGDGVQSVTKNATVRRGNWFGRPNNPLTVIDTPGLGEPDDDVDSRQILDLVQCVKQHGRVNGFLIVTPYSRSRFGKPTLKMIKFFEATFASGTSSREEFWNHVIFVFTSTLRHDERNPITPEAINVKRGQWQATLRQVAKVQLRDIQFHFVDSLSLTRSPELQCDVENRDAFQALRYHACLLPPLDVSGAVVVKGGVDFEHVQAIDLLTSEFGVKVSELETKFAAEQAARQREEAEFARQQKAAAEQHRAAIAQMQQAIAAEEEARKRDEADFAQRHQAQAKQHAATVGQFNTMLAEQVEARKREQEALVRQQQAAAEQRSAFDAKVAQLATDIQNQNAQYAQQREADARRHAEAMKELNANLTRTQGALAEAANRPPAIVYRDSDSDDDCVIM